MLWDSVVAPLDPTPSAGTPEAPALAGRGLHKAFGNVRAVDGVDLEVRPREVVALIGPNGAGKSTLLSLLAGLLVPDRGHAHIAGIEATARGGAARRQLGFVSGDTKLYERLTPREVLALFGGLHGVEDDRLASRVDAVCLDYDLTAFADRRCATLSSGQAQRVNLARAVVHDPSVLILDEPTTALDVASQRFVLEAVERARVEGRAVLFSSHVLGEVERVADRVSVLKAGVVVADGPLATVVGAGGEQGLAGYFTGPSPAGDPGTGP